MNGKINLFLLYLIYLLRILKFTVAFVTDSQIAYFLQKNLFESFLKIFEDIMRDCKYSPKLVDPPIRVNIFYIL